MVVCVAGSRYLRDRHVIWDLIEDVRDEIIEFDLLIHGACQGVDEYAHMWAKMAGIPVKQYPAKWSFHKQAAGPIRNQEMAKACDVLIAFPMKGAPNKGTNDMIRRAKALNKQVFIFDL